MCRPYHLLPPSYHLLPPAKVTWDLDLQLWHSSVCSRRSVFLLASLLMCGLGQGWQHCGGRTLSPFILLPSTHCIQVVELDLITLSQTRKTVTFLTMGTFKCSYAGCTRFSAFQEVEIRAWAMQSINETGWMWGLCYSLALTFFICLYMNNEFMETISYNERSAFTPLVNNSEDELDEFMITSDI